MAEPLLLPNDGLPAIAFLLGLVDHLDRLPMRHMAIRARAEHAIEQAAYGAQADMPGVEWRQWTAEELLPLGVGHPLRLHPGR